ncbi:MAG: ABC transporter ATP-binding protein [Ktedonobacteraceae bacterium]
MTEKQLSSKPPSQPLRPVRLAAEEHTNEHLLQVAETPPEVPQFIRPLLVIPTRDRLPSKPRQVYQEDMPEVTVHTRSTAQMLAVKLPVLLPEDDISVQTTLKVPTTLVLFAPTTLSPSSSTSNDDLIYASTADARKAAKRRRIEEKELSWQDLKQFSQFVTPFKWQIVLSFFLTVGVGLTALPMPFIFHTMIDQVFPKKDVLLFTWSLVLLLGVFLVEEALKFINRNVIGSLSRSANLNIIYRFYRHMLRLPLSFYQGLVGTGQVLSRLNEVTSAQQTVLQMITDVSVNSILTLIYVGVLFLTDWRLTLAVLIVAPFYLGVSFYFNRRTRQLSRQVLESYAKMNGKMYEGLTGLKTIKALVAEHRFGRTVKKTIMETNQLSYQRTIFQSEANLIIGIVQAFGVVAILSYGGYLVLTKAMSAGQLAAFVLILRELSTPVTTLNGINQQLQAAAVAVDRLFEILNQPEETDAEKGIVLSDVRGDITLEHVSFSYTPEVEVLHDISLTVPQGTTIAFVGRSGAGKTTIANLLMRFYHPDKGRLTIDGYDLRDLKIESLRSHFGVILQDDSLFSGTIEENLTFGLLRKVSHEEMREAARNANILDFIESQPLSFKTVLKERGQSLSNGQRQRISIARMFLHQPKILVMDEPSSALDNESEALIQQALKRLTSGRTTFIIAHRLSTIRDANRIVIIDAGRVAEQGTHDELLARKGVYWHLYNSYGRV